MVSDTQESAPQSAADSKSTAQDSAVAWLLRGLVLGALVLGSANALSFFSDRVVGAACWVVAK